METLDLITCNKHQKTGIEIDRSTFKIICSKCLDTENNLYVESNHVSNPLCHKNCGPSMFYCDDCLCFLCTNCFLTQHRDHHSSTPELIKKPILESVKSAKQELFDFKKEIESNIEKVESVNKFFNKEKGDFNKSMDDFNNSVIGNLGQKSKEFLEEIEKIFNGLDCEVESSTTRLVNMKKKAGKSIEELENLLKELDSLKSDKKICLIKKSKDNLISNNIKFLSDLKIFINDSLIKTKEKSLKEMENFKKECTKFQMKAQIYENSITNTCISGIPNITMRIRRFKKYYFENSKYFKKSSVCLLTSHTINLVGFGICSLFNSGNKHKSLKFEIKIFELENSQKFDPQSQLICNQQILIPTTESMIDPVYQFYLKHAVTVHKDKVYYIIISNASDTNYIEVWAGEVSKDKDDMTENQNAVTCNNTGVKFNFITAPGVETDFNEFTGGILSDVIYSYTD
jgi:hypothetical protein